MAIQFPPLAPGDAEPVNGEEYIYRFTGEAFVCRRSSLDEAAQWAAQGAIQDAIIGYRGPLFIQQPAPTDANTGDIFSVADGGIADASFGTLAGQNIDQWSLVIFTGSDWLLVNAASTGPWIRTVSGRIQPTVQTDDLDMVDGNYLINELSLLGGSAPPAPDPDNIEVEGLSGLFNGPPFGEDENVQDVCNACDGDPDTYAFASTDDTDRIHIMHDTFDTSIVEIENTFEVKTQPNHYVVLVFTPEGGGEELEMQADQNGIATFTDISGPLSMVRVSTDSNQFEPVPQEETRVYYLRSDGSYLVDPDCVTIDPTYPDDLEVGPYDSGQFTGIVETLPGYLTSDHTQDNPRYISVRWSSPVLPEDERENDINADPPITYIEVSGTRVGIGMGVGEFQTQVLYDDDGLGVRIPVWFVNENEPDPNDPDAEPFNRIENLSIDFTDGSWFGEDSLILNNGNYRIWCYNLNKRVTTFSAISGADIVEPDSTYRYEAVVRDAGSVRTDVQVTWSVTGGVAAEIERDDGVIVLTDIYKRDITWNSTAEQKTITVEIRNNPATLDKYSDLPATLTLDVTSQELQVNTERVVFNVNKVPASIPAEYRDLIIQGMGRWNNYLRYNQSLWDEIKANTIGWEGLQFDFEYPLIEDEIFVNGFSVYNDPVTRVAAAAGYSSHAINDAGFSASTFNMSINEFYANLMTEQELLDVITHELGHGLGFVTGLYLDPNAADPVNNMLNAADYPETQAAYNQIVGDTYDQVPLQNESFQTAHWDFVARTSDPNGIPEPDGSNLYPGFVNEMMVWTFSTSDNPAVISSVTLKLLAETGYEEIDPGTSEGVPQVNTSQFPVETSQRNTFLLSDHKHDPSVSKQIN